MSLHQEQNKDIDVINGLATYHLAKGNPRKAISLFAQIPEPHSLSPYIALNHALALILSEKKTEARELIERVDAKQLESLSKQYEKIKQLLGDQA